VVGRPITQADDPKVVAEAFINHIREPRAHATRTAGD
jgi:3-keto-L-gulonate-6-phosphate decarboxylase